LEGKKTTQITLAKLAVPLYISNTQWQNIETVLFAFAQTGKI